MDPILQVLLSWQFVLFGLGVAIAVYVFRLVIEYITTTFHINLAGSNLWNNLVLPLVPIIFGIIGGILAKQFPYPGFTPDATGVYPEENRILFGLVAGALSTLMYRVIKSLLYQKAVDVAQSLHCDPPAYPTEQIPTTQLPARGQV